MVAVAVVWGGTYVVVQDAVAEVPPGTFLAYRFSAAALLLAPLCARRIPRRHLPPGTSAVLPGVVLGCVLFAAYALQTVGLQHTGASQAAFITGLMVVITPVIAGVLLRERVQSGTATAVVLAVTGLGLLSMQRMEFRAGDLLVLGCAFALAVHLLLLGQHAPRHDPYVLAVVQLATVGVLSLGWSLAAGRMTLPASPKVWIALGITATIASAAAFAVQTAAQRVVSPTKTALILTMEPVFAAITGHLTGERLTTHRWAGAALMLFSMLLVTITQRAADRPATR